MSDILQDNVSNSLLEVINFTRFHLCTYNDLIMDIMDHPVYHALPMTHSFWALERVTKVEIESKHEPGRPVAESPVTLADREAEDGPVMKCLDDEM